ncbi:MAG TPA: hypothetical protein VHU23_19940 [Rhizomicrobium sp.]|jgi:hypothetical protein|nr:hypothetical protein [Rhizomicrobium sp.]
MRLELQEKLEILADAAKYDASCASLGGTKRKAGAGEIGSVTGARICHSFTRDVSCSGATVRRGLLTVHPAFLLRLPDETTRRAEYTKFVADLKLAGRLVLQEKQSAHG